MPHFVRPSASAIDDASSFEPEPAYADSRPEWRDRPLEEDEVHRCATLILALLEHQGFSHPQIARIVEALDGAKAKFPHPIREAASMIPAFLARQGFDSKQVSQLIASLRDLVPRGTKPETGKTMVGRRLRDWKNAARAAGFDPTEPIP